MSLPTWHDLADSFCSRETSLLQCGENEHFERLAVRRYNYVTPRPGQAKLVFLKSASIHNPENATLVRDGKYVWCEGFSYEGKTETGHRQLSFNAPGVRKARFTVSERDVLTIPNHAHVSNNAWFRRKYNKLFIPFRSVFSNESVIQGIADSEGIDSQTAYRRFMIDESPYVPGTLVAPRHGLFYPDLVQASSKLDELVQAFCDEHGASDWLRHRLRTYLSFGDRTTFDHRISHHVADYVKWATTQPTALHPPGVVYCQARTADEVARLIEADQPVRELYHVNFGGTIYKEVHPIQLEIINEV